MTGVVWSAILATAGLLVICLLAYPESHMAKLSKFSVHIDLCGQGQIKA